MLDVGVQTSGLVSKLYTLLLNSCGHATESLIIAVVGSIGLQSGTTWTAHQKTLITNLFTSNFYIDFTSLLENVS